MAAASIIVTAPGSLGDVNPMLAIARALKQSGHEILFLAAERYLPLAQRAGLATRSLVTESQFQRLAGNPQLWHPRHGARLIFREAVEHFLEPHYAWLQEHCVPGETVLVSHILDFAGRIYRDAHPTTKFVSVLPAPALLRSYHTPPRLSSYFWERWLPPWSRPWLYRAADHWLDRVGGKPINDLRRSLGLPQVHRILHQWWWSPDLVLCLFPEWFSVDPRDVLPTMRLIGFPLADSADCVAPEVSQQLADVWSKFDGQPPIVFAPGTAHEHARDFLQVASQVCQRLERPGILISTNATQLPNSLPSNVVSAQYLPFSQILPRAAAIVHHGGVGTTSQALRAGVPQVVLPMAFDQFDNGERVQRLGCGSWFPMRRLNTSKLIQHVQHLPHTATGTADIAARIADQPSATALAVQAIESLIATQ
jgi:UDP:flavonoid glycosyltransferase YjiC (YdhE family)